jgi:molybdate transport system substrate-binding protein
MGSDLHLRVRFVLVLVLVLATWLGCSGEPLSSSSRGDRAALRTPLAVAAASDLKFAFDELIREFESEHPAIEIQVTYGSSGNFFAQLSNRAPFDIYFSADVSYPRQLVQQGLADGASELLYAIGQIVVWVPGDSPLDVERRGKDVFLDPGVRKVAIANPRHAPYGRAAESALKALGVYAQVKDRLVVGENIAQAAQFVESGGADVGIIALSLATAPAMEARGRYWKIPLDAYPTMEQGSVILNWVKDRAAADRFRAFVAGPRGRDVLQRYGFRLPGE